MEITERKLLSRFVASALDKCAKRDNLSKEQIDYLHNVLVSEALDQTSSMQKPEGVDKYLQDDGKINFEKLVPVAVGHLRMSAMNLGESEINGRVVKDYILEHHNRVLEQADDPHPENHPVACGVHELEVTEGGRNPGVKFPLTGDQHEHRQVNDPFEVNPKKGEKVLVHRYTLLGRKHELMK